MSTGESLTPKLFKYSGIQEIWGLEGYLER